MLLINGLNCNFGSTLYIHPAVMKEWKREYVYVCVCMCFFVFVCVSMCVCFLFACELEGKSYEGAGAGETHLMDHQVANMSVYMHNCLWTFSMFSIPKGILQPKERICKHGEKERQ